LESSKCPKPTFTNNKNTVTKKKCQKSPQKKEIEIENLGNLIKKLAHSCKGEF
jgi:hypothetical protein